MVGAHGSYPDYTLRFEASSCDICELNGQEIMNWHHYDTYEEGWYNSQNYNMGYVMINCD